MHSALACQRGHRSARRGEGLGPIIQVISMQSDIGATNAKPIATLAQSTIATHTHTQPLPPCGPPQHTELVNQRLLSAAARAVPLSPLSFGGRRRRPRTLIYEQSSATRLTLQCSTTQRGSRLGGQVGRLPLRCLAAPSPSSGSAPPAAARAPRAPRSTLSPPA